MVGTPRPVLHLLTRISPHGPGGPLCAKTLALRNQRERQLPPLTTRWLRTHALKRYQEFVRERPLTASGDKRPYS
ncbi:hypothetical protein NDU88_010850 [Pleurodeles waltl]|uniref:Uncharacterized protein n=1 Tax=Pleurodeles waltl TaxID=8319 RepID=A0AAV7S2K3_PLEWA|nr:hypothetical protein NDU88_010850 [Pleurodeles waltl]